MIEPPAEIATKALAGKALVLEGKARLAELLRNTPNKRGAAALEVGMQPDRPAQACRADNAFGKLSTVL